MEFLGHLFTALGRVLLWISSVLVLEELTLAGLARLLLSRPCDSRGGRKRKNARGASIRLRRKIFGSR
jgi:hypothetical protein